MNFIGVIFTEKLTFINPKSRANVTAPPIYWPSSKRMAIKNKLFQSYYQNRQTSWRKNVYTGC